jgi:hypothetical protein
MGNCHAHCLDLASHDSVFRTGGRGLLLPDQILPSAFLDFSHLAKECPEPGLFIANTDVIQRHFLRQNNYFKRKSCQITVVKNKRSILPENV